MAGSKYRADIDGLRSIAVVSVLLFHVGFSSFSGGFVGVDVFFVISGFLITRLIKDEVEAGTFRFGNFYMRRVRRLAPTMIVVLALSFAAAYAILSPADMELFSGSLVAALLSVSNFFFWWNTDYFGAEASVQPLLHTWSLAVEEQFYFIWPALLILLLTRFLRPVLFCFLAVAAIASLLAAQWWIDIDAAAAFFLLPFRVFEFAIGAAMVWLVRFQPRDPRLLEPIFAIGLGAIVVPVFLYTKATPFPGGAALLPCLGTALVIFAGQAKHLGLLLRNRISVGIGLISYTLYLVHWPVVVFYGYYKFHELTLIDRIAIIAISFVLSAAIYQLIENPLRHGRIGARRIANPIFASAAAIAAFAVMVPAAAAYQGGGWGWRLSDDVREWLGHAGTTPRRQPMEKPLGAKYKVLLLGDSHARAYSDMLISYFMDSEVHMIFERNPCVPLPNILRYVDGKPASQCHEHSRRIKYLIRKGRYDGVIISSRWSSTLEGKPDPREEGADWRTFAFADDESISRHDYSPENSKRIFTRQINDLVAYVQNRGIPMMIMGEVPPTAVNLRPCLVVHGRACTPHYTKDEVAARISFGNETFIRIAAEHPLIRFVNAFEIICGEARLHCPIFEGDTFLYRDGNHINRMGALALLPKFRPSLDDFVDLIRTTRQGPLASAN